MNIRNVLAGLIASAVLGGILAACGGGYGGSNTYMSAPPSNPAVVRSAALDGPQAGNNTVTGTGRGAVVVDQMTMEITGGITFTGVTSPTAAEIRRAADASTVVTLVLAPDGRTATVPAGTMLLNADYMALLAGMLYFTVDTAAHANGEISGPINGMTGVTAGRATLNSAQEYTMSMSPAMGKGTLVVDSATGEIIIGVITYSGLTMPATSAALYYGFPGNLAISKTADFTPGAGTTNIAVPAAPGSMLTPTDMLYLGYGYLYFNVFTTTYPSGEIRGQIQPQ